MSITYIISQIFVVIATICLGISYVTKDKKTIMLLCVVYGIFYGTHYLLLGATTGFIMTLVSISRNIWFYINAKNNKKNSRLVLIILVIIAVVTGLLSYQDIFSITSIMANILSTYSIWQDNVKLYRYLAVPVSFAFIAYAVHIRSTFSIITELVLLLIEIIGILDIIIKTKKITSRQNHNYNLQ